MNVPSSTLDDCESGRQGHLAVWSRRGLLAALFAIVLAAAAGFLGVADVRQRAEGGGYELELLHARSARAGLDVPWEVTVRHPGGFPGDSITLAVTASYFDIYETQGFWPDPSDATREGNTVYLTFNKPPGDTFVVAYDAYIQPSSESGRNGTLSVVVDGRSVVSLDFTTTLMP